MQSRKMSFVESWVNVVIGFLINLAGQLIIYPLVGIKAHLGQNLLIGVFFTVISIIRSYTVRRHFNKKQEKSRTIGIWRHQGFGQKPRK